MHTETLILILGICSSITLIISAFSLHRGRLLFYALLTSLLTGTQFALISDTSTLLVCLVGALRSVIILLSLKNEQFSHWSVMGAFILTYLTLFFFTADWASFAWFTVLPTIGAVIATVAFFFKDVLKVKLLLLAVGILWLTYEYNTAMYSQMVGEGFTLVANAVAAAVLISARRKGIPDTELVDVDTQIISTITSSIPVIRDTFTGSIPKQSTQM